jgi:hypothetical protein
MPSQDLGEKPAGLEEVEESENGAFCELGVPYMKSTLVCIMLPARIDWDAGSNPNFVLLKPLGSSAPPVKGLK